MAIDDAVAGAADKLIQAIEKFGPQAVGFSMDLGRIAAVQSLLWGVASLAMALLTWRFAARPLLAKIRSDIGEHGEIFDTDPITFFGCGATHVFAGLFLLDAVVKLANIFAWVGLVRPELYLAAHFLKL